MSQALHDHHPVPAERPPDPSPDGGVILDIGGDRGAAVIYTDAGLAGAEIEIRPHDKEWRGVHTAVRERPMAGRVTFAAVFGSLRAGAYDLRVRHAPGGGPVLPLAIVGGAVTEVTWGPTT